MMYKLNTLFLVSILLFSEVKLPLIKNGSVLGTSSFSKDFSDFDVKIKIDSSFLKKIESEFETIPFEKEFVEDKDLEIGNEIQINPGVNGSIEYVYENEYWYGKVTNKILLDKKVIDPKNEVISKGTKIIWREYQTPDAGEIKYWRKMRVFATKYDHNCLGCNYTTAVGAYLQKGVCAVDPKVIKMYTKFYVPGYGMCQALDVGGLIKGNRIDLAYEDTTKVSWGAEYVDIYIIDNAPEN